MEEVLSAVNSEFADQLDGEIEYVNLPWDNFYQVHLTAVNSGTAPDIFAAGYGTAETFARMGEIYYMDNLDADEEFASKFSEAIGESRRYEGKLVQLPYMVGIDMLYYRTDMFAEVGYTESPKTWDEFMDALRKVKESIENQMPEDFYSIDLMDAYESLGSITGETIGEDLVNEIFSKFCMGK